MSRTSTVAAQDVTQVVGFRLGAEEFAVPILAVLEINHRPRVTAVPHSPHHVKGITNLRGRVIPVVDLAERFGLTPADRGQSERMIVVDVGGTPVGFLVDAVTNVRRIDPAVVSPPPPSRNAVAEHAISGIARLDQGLLILLDAARLVCTDDLPDPSVEAPDLAAESGPLVAA